VTVNFDNKLVRPPPSLPFALLHSVPTQRRFLHRLVYYALPTTPLTRPNALSPESMSIETRKVIKFEVILPKGRHWAPMASSIHKIQNGILGMDDISADGESGPVEDLPLADSGLRTRLWPRCWSGLENTLNLLMPDR